MQFQGKTALGALIFFLAALGCTPALAQQGSANPPAAPQEPSNNPSPPPQQTPGMRVWVAPGPGAGWAAWRTEDNQGRAEQLGIGSSGLDGGLSGPLQQAQRALHDPLIRQQLGISDSEANALETQVADFQREVIQDEANLRTQQVDLENLLASENPDHSAIENKLEQANAARLTLQKAALNFYLTVKQQVTPEQQQKIRQFLRERQSEGLEQRRGQRSDSRTPPRPGSSSYVGSQPPDGSSAYQENQPHYWQNSQSQPEESPAPQPYNMGEPQGSTPLTNNQ